jgi:hypothetical protein
MSQERELLGVRLVLSVMVLLLAGCGLRTILTQTWPGSDAPIAAEVPKPAPTPTSIYWDCPAPVIPLPVETRVALIDSIPTPTGTSKGPTTYTITWTCDGGLLQLRVGDKVDVNLTSPVSSNSLRNIFSYAPDILGDEGERWSNGGFYRSLTARKQGSAQVIFSPFPSYSQSDDFALTLNVIVR